MSPTLVVPSNIPWSSLKQVDLEECLYWLLDDLGAKDLEWRKGGEGGGGTDQGRDLEATFYASSPDDELDAQRWWIESKGRSKTVEPSAVKDAVTNTESRNDISVLVIATNTQFSNPTRDWVKQWQANHPRPKVRLWDRNSLERMLVKHPAVAVRLFSDALSLQGRVEAIRSRFWNQCYLPSERELDRVWKDRADVCISSEAALALVAGEVANGDLNQHPWMMLLSDDDLKHALIIAIANTFYILPRAEKLGTNVSAIEAALANTLMTVLSRFSAEDVWNLIENMWSLVDGDLPPPKLQQAALNAAVEQMVTEMANVCSHDCERVGCDFRTMTFDEKEHYWERFVPPKPIKENGRDRSGVLIIEKKDAPCNVGLLLNEENRCPLVMRDNDRQVNKELLNTYRTIIAKRVEQIGAK